MMKPQKYKFETGQVTFQHSHVIEPDSKEKFGPEACGEYSLHMLMDDAEARKLMDKIDEVIAKTIPHLKKLSNKFHYPGILDEKTGLYKFRCKHNPEYGRPEVTYNETGFSVTCEIPNGSTGEVHGIVHPYEDYGGGIKLIVKRVIVHKLAGGEQVKRESIQQNPNKLLFPAKPTVTPPWEDNEPVKPVIHVKTVQPATQYTFAPPVPPPSPTPIRREPTIDTVAGSLSSTTITEPNKLPSIPAAANDDNGSDLAARFVSMRMRSIGR